MTTQEIRDFQAANDGWYLEPGRSLQKGACFVLHAELGIMGEVWSIAEALALVAERAAIEAGEIEP